ncbi:MAG TPA: hypothetical protein VGH51_20055 [Candidatus Angelobacter sp.]|jgi:hypothetical protein
MEDATAPKTLSPEFVKLHSGNALKFSEIQSVTRRSYTPIIFLAGDVKSGKTTLLGSIHDAFQFGPLEGYKFAGCETPVALEERCFESRVRSGARRPDTPRTRYEAGQEYLHLRLRKDITQPFQEILFADMSGEFYERAIQNSAELAEFSILKRSDYLVLLLDGGKLLDHEQRQNVRQDGLTFLRRCQESGLLRESTTLQVMISKWDVVLQRPQLEQDQCFQFITSRFNETVIHRQVSVIRAASRPSPDSSGVDKLFGLKSVFVDWMEITHYALRARRLTPQVPESAKIFNQISSQ